MGADDLVSKAEEQIDSAPESKADSDAWILALPQHWRAVYTASLLDAEVINGGLHQFFWNTDGKFNDALGEDLKYIGATAHSDLFSRAVAIYARHDYAREKERAGNNLEPFTDGYKEQRFEALDNEYYKLPDVRLLVGKFIKQHAELYPP